MSVVALGINTTNDGDDDYRVKLILMDAVTDENT